jgi:hypothetical protein
MNILEKIDKYLLRENSTDDAKETLDAIIGFLEKQEDPDPKQKSMLKMANGMLDYYEKEESFSPDQAKWIYNTSKGLF